MPVWVLAAVCHLLNCHVMGVRPAFALVLGCFAECNNGLPPGPVCVLLQRISAASITETSNKSWEPSDSGDCGIGFVTQSIRRVAERNGKSSELKQGCRVNLSSKARPVELLSMTFKSRLAVFYYC